MGCFFIAVIFFSYGKDKATKIWGWMNLAVGGWALFVGLATLMNDAKTAYLLWRISHVIGIYVSIFFFHFVCALCKLKFKYFIGISYLYGLIWGFLVLNNNGFALHNGVYWLYNSFYYLDAKNLPFTMALFYWFALALIGLFRLYFFYKNTPSNKSSDAFIIAACTAIGYSGGASTFVPMYGVHFYPLTIILVAFYAFILSYAIFRHQILELKVIFEKSLIYSILIGLISVVYIILISIAEHFFRITIGYTSTIFSIFIISVIAAIFAPLRNQIQFMIDKFFFKGTHPEIAEQNDQLRQKIAQSERFKIASTMAGSIAHEIKNPLTTIKIFTEKLPDYRNDPAFLSKYSQLVGQEVERVSELVNRLMDFAKPATPQPQHIDIVSLINETLEFANNDISKHSIKIEKNFNLKTPILVNADPNQLRQCFLNLFLNAKEAMLPNGGILNITISTPKSDVIVETSDTGCGIDSKDLKRIFEPFYTTKDTGSGLGLSITKGLIEANGGKIEVRSQKDKGTTFIVKFPLINSLS
ncbi:MAG: ATP-binding protein [Candidatus Omnitrophica bacterium]|nr:ATP-binding protein [Candidatus Omnitrophota bacterium]